MLTLPFRPAFLAVPLLLVLAPASDELAFHPKADTELAKTLALELEVALDDFSLEVNGQELGKDSIQGLDGMGVVLHVNVGTTDKYVKCADGKIVELLRTFDELTLKTEMGDESKEDADLGAFAGKTARFNWDAEKKEYVKSWVEAKADDEALAGLHPDADITCLLPDAKVKEGDTWKVKGEALTGLFFPGGMFPAGAEEDSGSNVDGEALLAELEKKLQALEVTCTYKGAHEDGKKELGEIAFQFDGSVELDLAKLIEEAIAEDAEEMPDFEMKSSMKMKGEGTLLWDVAAGHLHSMKMNADLGLSIDATAHMDQEGQSLDIKAHFAASGKGDWSLAVK
ncbi:MAG: hypothetical protein HZA53_09200 [Planctomycetes bacterium]|nr:hypothetical protein [Planctomycetota bacterium]